MIDPQYHYCIGIYKGRGLLAVRLKRGPLHASVRKAVPGSERRVRYSGPRADPERTRSEPGAHPKRTRSGPKISESEPEADPERTREANPGSAPGSLWC